MSVQCRGANNFTSLEKLEIYISSRKMSKIAWKIYKKLTFKEQKLIGDQFLRATDSIGANITEGYGRFHYLDKIKFFYNSRGSYLEAKKHWLELLNERNLITKNQYYAYNKEGEIFYKQLNGFISYIYKLHSNKSKN
ncbi:MAG: four helix bundle protein [Flavobacteriales bacterium]